MEEIAQALWTGEWVATGETREIEVPDYSYNHALGSKPEELRRETIATAGVATCLIT